MSVRAKTKKRLLILVGVSAATLAAGAGGVMAIRSYRRHQAYLAGQKGLIDARAGDYVAALPELGQYLSRYPRDNAALFYYATAREAVEEPNHRNLSEALGLWRQLISADPSNMEARHKQLDLYIKIGYAAETLDAAQAILQRDPKDMEGLRGKAVAESFQRKFKDAIATISACNKLYPTNLQNQLLEMQIRASNGASDADLVKRAKQLQIDHPKDPTFDLLLSIEQAGAGDRSGATASARAAAAGDVKDADFVTALVRQLDYLQLYSEGLAVARRAADQHSSDMDLHVLALSRLFIAGDYPQLDALLKDTPPTADARLVALQAMTEIRMDKKAEAKKHLDALIAHPTSNSAGVALARAVRAAWLDTGDIRPRLDTCTAALQVDPNNPFLRYFVGLMEFDQGDAQEAVRTWQSATSIAPAWPLPITTLAQAILPSQPQQALLLVKSALQRSPTDHDALVLQAAAFAATIKPDQQADWSKLLTMLHDLHEKFPSEQSVYPLKVNALAKLHRESDAAKAVRDALAITPALSRTTYIQLAAVSAADKLGLEKNCFDACEAAHGLEPELALSKAGWLYNTHHADEALKLLQDGAAAHATDPAWQLDLASYLEISHSSDAAKTWNALAKQFPANLPILWSINRAPSVAADHALQGRVLDSLSDKLGDTDTKVSLARAKWLLQGNDGKPSEKDLSAAATLLSNVTRAETNLIEPRLLLANCLEQLRNISGAVEQLRAAAQIQPGNATADINLARLLITQGDTSGAHDQLTHLDAKTLTPDDRQRAAGLYARLGDPAAASSLLAAGPDLDPAATLMLAKLYVQQQDFTKADGLVSKLLARPDPAIIRFAANLYLSENKPAEAQAAIAKLDALTAGPGVADVVRAQYLLRLGKTADGLAQYKTAIKAAPQSAEFWNEYLSALLTLNDTTQALSVAADAHRAIPADAGFARIDANAALIHGVASVPMCHTVLLALVQQPSAGDALVSTMRIITAAQAHQEKTADTLAKIKQLADSNPNVFAIQSVAAQLDLIAGRNEDAITIGSRAVQTFAGLADAHALYAQTLAVAQRWTESLAAARQWRALTPEQPLHADVAIAEAQLHLAKSAEAIQQLQPYLASALKAPNDNRELDSIYVRTLIQEQHVDKAAALIEPWLTDAQWQNVYVRLAAQLPNEKDAVAWLDHADKVIPAEAASERSELAIAWQTLSERLKKPAYLDNAVAIMSPLAAPSDANAVSILLLARIYEVQNNLPAAESAYRRVLKTQPDQLMALNNLAMVLAKRDKDLQEALKDVSHAIALSPDIPAFYDTRAAVCAKLKSFDLGLKSIDQATRLDPANPNWQATHIWLLALSGKTQDAHSEYQQLRALSTISQLTPESKRHLASIGMQ